MSSVTTVTTVTGKSDMPPRKAAQRNGWDAPGYVRNPVGGHAEKSGYSGYHGYGVASVGRRRHPVNVYGPSPTKRARRTRVELEAPDASLASIVEETEPATVRQVFYQTDSRGGRG